MQKEEGRVKEIRFSDANIEKMSNGGKNFKMKIEKIDNKLKEWSVYH